MNAQIKKKHERRKEARPSELIAAALDLFVARGFAATKMDDIAIHAGISKGTLYLYFESKEALFKAVIEQGVLPLLKEGELLLQHFDGNAQSLLQEFMLLWWQRMSETNLGGIPKLIISEAGNFPDVATYYYENVIVRGRNLIGQVLKLGMTSGEFREMDIESSIDVIMSPVVMLLVWRHSLTPCGTQNPQHYMQTYLDLILNGLMLKKELSK